jgi:hypothetical protein
MDGVRHGSRMVGVPANSVLQGATIVDGMDTMVRMLLFLVGCRHAERSWTYLANHGIRGSCAYLKLEGATPRIVF